MICLQRKNKAESVDCPYLQDRRFIQEFFLAIEVNENEFSQLLEKGWRKFGYYFFRPVCSECRECVPIRILTERFRYSKTMKKILRKNSDVEISIGKGDYTEERYQVFKKHSEIRFNTPLNRDSFKDDFCISAVPSVFMDYRCEGSLIGIGVVDISSNALSSVYFAFDPDYSARSPGIFSMLIEIETAKKLEKQYYYPGYYIEGNKSMSYKAQFKPHERLDWDTMEWLEYSEDVSEEQKTEV